MKTRRSLIVGLIAGVAVMFGIRKQKTQYSKVKWVKLHDEPVTPGDMWASMTMDPNDTERQGECGYNLQMQAIHPSHYGFPAKEIPRGNGDYWRPVAVIQV